MRTPALQPRAEILVGGDGRAVGLHEVHHHPDEGPQRERQQEQPRQDEEHEGPEHEPRYQGREDLPEDAHARAALHADGHLPVDFKIVSTARSQLSRDEFVADVRKILDARPEPVDDGLILTSGSR